MARGQAWVIGPSWWQQCLPFLAVWLACSAAFSACMVPRWAAKQFGHVEFDQVLFTLWDSHGAWVGADQRTVRAFVRVCLVNPSLLALLTLLGVTCWRPRLRRHVLVLAWLLAAISVVRDFDVPKYLVAQFGSDQFASEYVDPATVVIHAPQVKPNLLLIYVESLEKTYGNKDIFGADLLATLRPFEVNGFQFAQIKQTPGTGWTIAGVISSQCGIPLKILGLWDANSQDRAFPSFLPNATCLGDVLASNGYLNVFLNGPDLQFSGMGKFMQSHGYHEVLGKQEWLARGVSPDDVHDWGVADDQLLRQAQHKLDDLMQQSQPFNLTLLTIDTHGPDGFENRSCGPSHGFNGFGGVVRCSVTAVSRLLQHIEDRGWQSRIKVVILGDHLAMKNPVAAQLAKVSERSPYNLFYPADRPGQINQRMAYFDFYPTILSFMGFQLEGEKLGLGRNALHPSGVDEPQRWEKLEGMLHPSTRYAKLWGEQ